MNTENQRRIARLKELERVAGLKKERGFQWSELSVRAIAMIVVFATSWMVTVLSFAVWTERGRVYENSLVPRHLDGQDTSRTAVTEGYHYVWWSQDARLYQDAGQGEAQNILEFRVFLAGRMALKIYAGRLKYLAMLKEGWKSECGLQPFVMGEIASELSVDGYGLGWVFADEARDGVVGLFGEEAKQECRILVSYQETTGWTPYARDAVVDIPRGGIVPLVGMLLQRAVTGLNDNTDDGGGVNVDAEVVAVMTQRLSDSVIDALNYDKLEVDLKMISFVFGPIQFLALNTAFVSVMLLIMSLWFWWARRAVDIAMNLIPYIGFFGTLLGMGTALLVLGEANLSDPVSKAINLGPIGSRLALAIETTKWALVCYSVVSLLVLLRDSVFGRRENQDGGNGAE